MAQAATTARPLTAAERATLGDLLNRAILLAPQRTARAPKVGSLWQAIENLSVPRSDGQTDLVIKGNTVTLTDEEAECFLPPHKPFAMIRRATEASQPLPQRHPRQHWGAERGVPGPMHQGGPVEQGGARPDPAGATSVTTMVITEGPPEGREPVPGDENVSALAAELGLQTQPPQMNAEDITPGTARLT